MSEIKEAHKPKAPNGAPKPTAVAPSATSTSLSSTASPMELMRRFAGEMDRLFEDFGLKTRTHFPRFLSRGHELFRREPGLVSAEWSPQINILRREGQLVVSADLPGMSKDDIKVEVTDDMLTIHGERKHEKKEEREGCCYSECTYGSFYRAIPLPEGAEGGKATAEFNKGVLEVTIPAPNRPEVKAKRLEVREGK